MPTTSLGIPYPNLDAVISASDIQATMEAIDALVVAVSAEAAAVKRGPGARVFGAGPLNIPSGTSQTFVFTFESYDSAGIADLATNNQRLTLTSGVWLVGGDASLSGSTNCDAAGLSIESQLQGTVCGDTAGPCSQSSMDLSTTGLIATQGEYITMSGFWIGVSSAAGSGTSAQMWAHRLRDY